MIRATVTPRTDLTAVVGCRVPSEVTLPWVEWPIADGGPILLPECEIAPCVARARPAPFTAKKKEPLPGSWIIGEAPKVADTGAPLAPRAFVDWLVGKLSQHGPVEPVEVDQPARVRLVKEYHARKVTGPALNPGSNADVAWAIVAHNLDLAVRGLGLDVAAASALVDVPPEIVHEAQRAGISRPGTLRDEVMAEIAADEALRRQDAERAEAIRRRETEILPIDLQRASLAEVTTDDPHVLLGRRKVYDEGRQRVLMQTHGLPIGDVIVHVATPGGGVGKVRIRDTGTAGATRRELDEVAALDERIVEAMHRERLAESRARPPATLAELDPLTVEGRHAWQSYRARVGLLVTAAATAPRHVAARLWHLVWTLPIGFNGAVSTVNAIDATQDALRCYVASTSRAQVYGRHGKPTEVATVDAPWPANLPTPESVGQAMKQEMARGSCWRPGEAYAKPTLADVQRLRLELDPNVFDRTVEAFIAERGEVRSADVHAHLYGQALINSDTPNARERGRVTALLERAGFIQVAVKADGKRARVWRRPAPEAA